MDKFKSQKHVLNYVDNYNNVISVIDERKSKTSENNSQTNIGFHHDFVNELFESSLEDRDEKFLSWLSTVK